MIRLIRFSLLIWAVALLSVSYAQTDLSIATGGTGGVHYPVGGAYAELVNKYLGGYTAVAEVTGASVENVALISRGDTDIALALADTVYQAYTGTGPFAPDGDPGVALSNLRALGSAYSNAVHILTLADSGVNSLADLAGKRVSVGAPGSGTEVSAAAILAANGLTYDDIEESFLNYNETTDALSDGQIDAGFLNVGAPTSAILSLAETRNIKLVPLTQAEIDATLAVDPTSASYTLPRGTYKGQDEDVLTLGTA